MFWNIWRWRRLAAGTRGLCSPGIVGDEKFYNALQKFQWYYQEEKSEFKFAKEFIKPNDKVLDIGCGKGAFAKLITCKEYVGLDLSSKASEMAKKT